MAHGGRSTPILHPCPSQTPPSSHSRPRCAAPGLRQTLLTNNIANANTPGYQREDLNFQGALRDALASGESPDPGRADARSSARGRRPRRQRRRHRPGIRAARRERTGIRGGRPGHGRPRRNPALRDGPRLMGLFDAIDIAGSGLTAERVRMDVTSENLANAQTTRAANGQPYQRQEVVLQQTGSPLRFRLDPRRRTRGGRGLQPGTRRRRQGRGDRRRQNPRPARLRPWQSRSRQAGLCEDAKRQHRHRNGRPDLRVALLPVRRDRHADRQVDVHRHPRATQMTERSSR